MLNDVDTMVFRHAYYSLFVRLLWREPSVDVVAALQDDIGSRSAAADAVHTRMGQGWQVIRTFLAEQPYEAVAEEFTTLFLGPFEPQVQPYESYYLTGHLFREPLVSLRGFLKQVGVEKQEQAFAEPEDVLAFELEVMRWLVAKQQAAAASNSVWLAWQAQFLKQHLLVWGPSCVQDIEQAAAAYFYRGVAMLLGGFLDVERRLFQPSGIEPIASLDEARQRYGGRALWHGPTFEVT